MRETNERQRDAGQGAVRLFFVDERTSDPVAGVLVNIFMVTASSEPRTTTDSQHLGTLVTDQAGYASFKFNRSIAAAASQFRVTHGTSSDPLLVNVAELLAGKDTYTIRLDAAASGKIVHHFGIPAVMEPDPRDAILSPGSIGLTPHLLPGRGLCGQLMPTTMGIRRFLAFQIRADICTPQILACPSAPQTQIVKGKILEYEVAWHPAGSALGELLNTITLAPCEQVNVAIADWTRRETASRDEATTAEQRSVEQIDHDRLIVETMQSSVKTKGAAAGFSTGATFPIYQVDCTAAFGAAGSISRQDVAASTTSKLSEHITKAASSILNRRSSVVFQATASEQHVYQTRTIRNHNHCHTLTLMYYQVNRNYRIVTEFKGERDAILVAYPNEDFDAKRAHCNAAVLRAVLLDPGLDRCFDLLGDALFCCKEKEEKAVQDLRMDTLTISAGVAENHNTSFLKIILRTANGQIDLPQIPVMGWQPGSTHTQTVTLPAPIDPAAVNGIAIVINGFMSPLLFLKDLQITYHATGISNPLTLYSSQTLFPIQGFWQADVKAEIPPPAQSTEDNPCVEASCCIKKLIGHLNCHKRYYNSFIWLEENPNDRIMRWSCCRNEGGSFDLIGMIENTPIAVYGDFLVFPVAGSPLADDPTVLPVSTLVTMPTSGVYAEGILGQCDTCEIIDPNRFWKWQDSPCTGTAPSVSTPPNPQAGVKPDDLKPEVISNLITLSSVPDAPDSIFKGLIETLLSKADDGSKEAKALLDKMLDLLKEGLKPRPNPPKGD